MVELKEMGYLKGFGKTIPFSTEELISVRRIEGIQLRTNGI